MVQCRVWSELQLCTSGRMKKTYPAFIASVKLGWHNNVRCLSQFSVDSTLILIWAFWGMSAFLWWPISTDAAVLSCKAQNHVCVLCSCPPMTCWPVYPAARCDWCICLWWRWWILVCPMVNFLCYLMLLLKRCFYATRCLCFCLFPIISPCPTLWLPYPLPIYYLATFGLWDSSSV